MVLIVVVVVVVVVIVVVTVSGDRPLLELLNRAIGLIEVGIGLSEFLPEHFTLTLAGHTR